MKRTLGWSFLAGVLGTNGTAHFIKGILREPFPSAAGSGPVPNVVGGMFMYVLSTSCWIKSRRHGRQVDALAGAGAGMLVHGLVLGLVGGRGKGPSGPTRSPLAPAHTDV